MIDFVRRSVATYIGNAAAVRDFRSQLRGNKPVLIWGLYLGLLVVLCMVAYSEFVSQGSASISQLQGQLNQFYLTVMSMLGAVITLAAPALTASAITVERQRRSLDLVFSSPVTPRYLLVGKLIAGFRYLVMLLVLALPVTAVCVVLGGATWTDVLGAFLVLMGNGILLMAIGLLISSVSATTMSAIVGSYLAALSYVFFGSFFSLALIPRTFGMGGGTNEASWTVTISPFTAAMAAPTFTTIKGVEVPNWALGLVFALAMSRLLLAGAGSSLSPFGSPETKTLRVQGWIVAFLLFLLVGLPLGTSMGPFVGAGSPPQGYFVGLALGIGTVAMFFLLPHLVCYSRDADQKYRPDGLFSIRRMLIGTPSGALPYLWTLALAAAGGLAVGVYWGSGRWPDWLAWSMVLWSIGYVTLWWGLGRLVSSMKLGLRGARAGLMALMVLFIAIPVPIITMLMMSTRSPEAWETMWRFYILYPLTTSGIEVAWIYAIVSAVCGILFALLGEANLRRTEPRYSR